MKRRDLEKHLRQNGCVPEPRSGRGPHDVWLNPANGLTASVPRHNEINTRTGVKICDELGVPRIRKK